MKNNNLGKNIIYNTIGSFIYLFTQWLLIYIVLFINGYETEGMLSFVISLTTVFYTFSLFGMRNYQSTDFSNEHSEKTFLYSRLVTCIASLIFSIIYCLFSKYNIYTIFCVNVYLLFKFGESFVDVLHGSLQRKWLFKNIGISMALRGIMSLLSFSIVLFFTKELLISLIIMVIVTYVFIYIYDVKIYRQNFENIGEVSIDKIKKLLVICLPLAIYTTISNYALSYPKISIANILGNKVLGYYSTYANPAMIVQVAASFFINPLITYFAELYKENNLKKFTNSLIKCIIIIVIIGSVAIIGCTLFGKSILKLIFDKTLLDYYYLLNQMIIISLLTSLMWLFAGIITVIRKFKSLIYINIIYCIVIIGLSNRILSKYGLFQLNNFVIISMLFVIIIYILYIIYYLKKKRCVLSEKK